MATIQKSSKINFYKFVQVKDPTGGGATVEGATVKSVNMNTVAINNLGATVNSIAKITQDFKRIQLQRLELARKNQKDFEATYTKTQKKKSFAGFSPAALVKKPSWLEGLFKMLSGLIKAAIVIPALKWLSDPKNRKKVANMIEALSKLATFIFKVAEFGVTNTIEGLYKLLSDESSPWERIGGLVQGLTGLGTLLLGMRWLSNPVKIITDFGNVLLFLHKNLIKGKTKLLRRAGALGLLAAGAYGGYQLLKNRDDDGGGKDKDKKGKEMSREDRIELDNLNARMESLENEGITTGDPRYDKLEKKEDAILNKYKDLPEKAQGGWISGPQSGYGVSLDGGRSTSFIGHGTEYVARKSDGGAFVVPFDTPGTKRQPNLTNKRLGEAKNMGFNIPGFADGGTLPKNKRLSQKGAFDYIYDLAKQSGGAKFPEIVAAQAMHESNYLNPWTKSVYNATSRTNAFGQTGDRGWGTIPRKGFEIGWSKYDNLSNAVNDNIKLWHDVGNHPQNYNAFGNVLDGIAAVAPAYSPNADPENIKRGFTTDKYSKGMIRALKVGGFDIGKLKDKTAVSSSNSGSGRRPTGGILSNLMGGVKSFFGFGDKSESNNKKTKTQNKVKAVVPASHPDTGSGFTVSGTRDQSGRPLVFSQPAAQMFASAMRDSGIDLGSFVASSGRSKSKNSEIGGNPNSHHLYGEALDINGEGYQWMKANGKRYGWQYVYNHNPDSAHFKYVGAKAGTTPILSEAGKNYAGGNSLEGHIGEGAREGARSDDAKKKKMQERSPETKRMGDIFGGNSTGARLGGRAGAAKAAPASQFQEKREKQKLANQTKERNNARRQVTERSQEMIKEVMAAVAQQNGVNSQAIQAAQQALASVAGQTGAGNPTMIPSSSSGIGSIASTLQSTLNPLRGLVR